MDMPPATHGQPVCVHLDHPSGWIELPDPFVALEQVIGAPRLGGAASRIGESGIHGGAVTPPTLRGVIRATALQ